MPDLTVPDLTVPDLTAELELALEIADACDALTLPRFDARDVRVDWKANLTEVTEIDRAVEVSIAERLAAERPDHAVFGEEFGLRGSPDSSWRWVIDPIDGTSGFVRGIPVWATLLALTHVTEGPLVGVVSAPALGRRWWAARGVGAFADGRSCRVSQVDRLAEAQVSVTFNDGWDDLGLTHALVALQQRARRARGFGDFWQHCLVAEGALDVAVDAVGVASYDLAAVSVVVETAGGSFTDRLGQRSIDQGTAISTNGLLHDEVLALLTAGSAG